MKGWMLLFGAILSEVAGTVSMRAAVDDAIWIPMIVVCYMVAYTLVAFALRTGFAIGIVYAIWGAAGVALTAVLGAVMFGEVLTVVQTLGILLVIVGVVLVDTGSPHGDTPSETQTAEVAT